MMHTVYSSDSLMSMPSKVWSFDAWDSWSKSINHARILSQVAPERVFWVVDNRGNRVALFDQGKRV